MPLAAPVTIALSSEASGHRQFAVAARTSPENAQASSSSATVLGRNESGGWWRRYDEYDKLVTPILTHEQPIVGLETDGKRRKSRLPRQGGRPRTRRHPSPLKSPELVRYRDAHPSLPKSYSGQFGQNRLTG
jgi:hypothetical protein